MIRHISLLVLLLVNFGCVQSLHPYYKEEQVTYDPALAGTLKQAEGKDSFVATAQAEDKSYAVAYTDKDGKAGHFIVHLFKVNETMMADVSPGEPKLNENEVYQAHLLPLHSFLIWEQKGDSLKIRTMDYDWF